MKFIHVISQRISATKYTNLNAQIVCVRARMLTNLNKWVLNAYGKPKSIDWSFGFVLNGIGDASSHVPCVRMVVKLTANTDRFNH